MATTSPPTLGLVLVHQQLELYLVKAPHGAQYPSACHFVLDIYDTPLQHVWKVQPYMTRSKI